MRNSLILLLLYLFLPLSVSATEYYVATNGNDNNPGTLALPWATWQKGFNSISAGDILYIRGGTYTPGGFADDNMFCAVAVDGKKGTSANMFNVSAYPGENPVLDCRNLTSASYERMGVLLYNCDYWHLSGLEITRCDQLSTGARYGGQGLMLMNSNYNKIERTSAHHNGGPGLGMRGNCEENLFLNCDAYSNWDAYSDLPGDNADGFDVGFITYRAGNDRKNYFEGCRAWMNGDDGFDMYQMSGYHGTYYFTNCWAWKQGYTPDGVTQGGNGCGFKYGDDNAYSADAQIRRSTHNCIAYANRTRGFSQETANDVMEFYNNISYNNGLQGFSFVTYNLADVLRNNISYKNGGDIFASNQIHDHNSWDSNVTVSDADFLSINGSELEGPRKADGSLPDINFLHLASGSDLIDKGVNVGISYTGNAPDLGAFEVQSGAPAPVPAYTSSLIANASPSILEMTYSLTLANIVPSVSSFSVLVNSVARTVNTVTISGTKVQLALSNPVVYGDVVTVSYTKPSGNPIQTSAGGQAISVTSQPVTNNVNAIIPAYVSSAVANATPSLLELTYNLTLANIVPAASSFSVLVNSVARAVSTVALSGAKVQLTLASPVVYGDVVTVSYTKPSANPLQTSGGGQAISIVTQPVTNNVNAVIPAYVSSAVANATPSTVVITYNLTLANIVPAASSFSVLVNSVARTVSTVAISGTIVQLTLASPVVFGDVVTVSYSKPSSNALQTTAGGQAATISAQPVTNSVNGITPGYVSSAIANATPSLIEITYNLALANIVPAASSFSVLVNSAARTITAVVISGSKVQLTLSSPVVYGNIVTVSYTKPSSNPLQATSGGQALSISAQPVTNNVIGLIPVYVSSAVSNSTPALLEMTYNQTLANVVPAASSFTVIVNSVSRTVNSVIVSGTRVQLTLASRIVSGDIVTVSYVKPSAAPIQTTSGGTAAAISNQPVTNNCIDIAPTAAITSPVINSSFSSPANITITASASDADGSVSLVEFYNGSTKLGSASVAPYSFSWNNVASGNYSLTVIATDNQNTKTTSSAVTISVTNSTHTSNRHPIIRIFNPRKGITYDNITTVEIDADASDPDGTISKVEFYNGQTQLVELTSPPYSYTWKDVAAGSYSITAIATDNSGDTTLSSPVEFVVGGKVKYDANSDIINLYPNPNNGHFSIDFINPLQSDKSEIIITDMSGKQVYNGPVLKEEITKQFDLSSASAGIYVMMIRDKDIFVTKKFIKNSQ